MSLTLRMALRDPAAVGANTTLTVQLEPAATETLAPFAPTHEPDARKSPGFGPVNETLVIVRGPFPVLLT